MPIQRRFLVFLFLGTLTLSLWLSHVSLTLGRVRLEEVAIAQSPNADRLVREGVELYQRGDYLAAIARWQSALTVYHQKGDRASQAIVFENLARATQLEGNSEQAIAYWDDAIAYYRQTKALQKVGRLLTEQAQSYSNLGQLRKAIVLLCNVPQEKVCLPESALHIARSGGDRQGEAAALGSLGDAYRLRGDEQKAIEYLQASLKIAREIKHLAYISSSYSSLGNTYLNLAQNRDRLAYSARIRGDDANQLQREASDYNSQALSYLQKSLELARHQNDRLAQMQALLNLIPALERTKEKAKAEQAQQQALSLLVSLPDSRDKVYAAIDLTNRLQSESSFEETATIAKCLKPELQSLGIELLQQAISISKRIKDNRSESFALGELGRFYECRQDYKQALDLTLQARWTAEQDLNAKDSLYLWEWQAGRIFRATNQKQKAIELYERAIATLGDIRGSILVASRDLQFNFRDTVEPIYRQLVALKLEQASFASTQRQQEYLSSVLTTIDDLKLTELQNYFGDDCEVTVVNRESLSNLANLGEDTVVFNSIIFNNRTAIVASFPNGQKRFEWIDINSKTLREEVNQFRLGLESFFDPYNVKQAQKLYNWLIRPFAKDLAQVPIKTLVFIQDGILRSIPMAALHDGKQFLVQKYAIVTTPSLTLTESKPLDSQELQALILGLTKSVTVDGRRFPALKYVNREINAIASLIPQSKEILNDGFTRRRLQQELDKNNYRLVHIATHGEFGAVAQDTFLVTGNNEKLTINELDPLIRRTTQAPEKIELLTLTACQTAIGDERAALGLAGVAVQAGAKSALASLWYIEDAATAQLATIFYENLTQCKQAQPSAGEGSCTRLGLNKAEALQQAQLALINKGGQYAHPAYWAPYILIGNWL
jgi:CHAT domain-containing protein